MMQKTFRSILFLLLLLAMVGAFYLESKLQFSSGWHELVQIGIVVVTCALAWQWVIYDEMCELREIRKTEPVRYHYRLASPIQYMETLQNDPIGQRLNGTAKAATRLKDPLPTKKNIPKTMPISISPARVAHSLMSIGVVFALTVVMLLIGSKMLGEGVIAILYLVPIGWCTVRWGQIAGISAAITAALSFDFLFIPPYGTFTIGSLEGWLMLFLFTATAILVVGRIQTILSEEQQRERKATFLFEMVAAIANQSNREGIAQVIANQIQQNFLAQGVQVQLSEGWGYQPFTAHTGDRQVSVLSDQPDRALMIVSGLAVIGEIDIWQGLIPLPFEDDPMLQTMLFQTVAALDRVRMAEGKSSYPKQKPSYSEGDALQATHS